MSTTSWTGLMQSYFLLAQMLLFAAGRTAEAGLCAVLSLAFVALSFRVPESP